MDPDLCGQKNPIWYRNIKEHLARGLGNAEWKYSFPQIGNSSSSSY